MNFFDGLKEKEKKPYYLDYIGSEQVCDEENYQRQLIARGSDYFEIRIPETFLRLEREYWKGYAPLTVVVLRFSHDGKDREIPFIISSQTLLASFPKDASDWTEFYNTRVFGPFPYEGGDVELAIALYAVETQNQAKELFSLLDSLLSVFQVPLASQALQTADTITRLIEKFTGLNSVSRKLSYYQVFQEQSDLPSSFRDQYILKINAEANKIQKEKLWVRDGRLHTKDQSGEFLRASEWDYCLARIHASETSPSIKLPFWPTWKNVIRLIAEGNENMAHNAYAELIRQITLCKDLTERDRLTLPFVFKTNFESEFERFNLLHYCGSTDTPRYRSGNHSEIGAASLALAAFKLREIKTFPDQIGEGLENLSVEWDSIPKLDTAGSSEELSSELIRKQLTKVRTLISTDKLSPAVIADALTLE
ncbi:MAG: hypothetical protein V7752_17600 [Halopseudomonas sp.]